jgi:limonene 1,2-monooxygenase
MTFGVFMPPHHRVGQSPSLLLEQDLQAIELLDQLGYDEAWIGEHHSGGWEIVPSPELMIAAAAQRTRHIRLGTGVTALAFQHPFMLIEKMVMLDHMTKGRMMFGFGPGGNPLDARMLGQDPNEQRPMMEESLEAMLALLDGSEPVTRKASFFTLDHAELQLLPYTKPRFEIGVSSFVSPFGARLAGKYGLSLLSIGATTPKGYEFLATAWEIAVEQAERYGNTMDKRAWRLTFPMHLAETEEEARRQTRFGFNEWMNEYGSQLGLAVMLKDVFDETDIDRRIDRLNESGFGVIGTPEMAVAQIRRLQGAAPGFGALLLTNFGWAQNQRCDAESFEVFARYVIPEFTGQLATQDHAHQRLKNESLDVQRRMAESRALAKEAVEADRVKPAVEADRVKPAVEADRVKPAVEADRVKTPAATDR